MGLSLGPPSMGSFSVSFTTTPCRLEGPQEGHHVTLCPIGEPELLDDVEEFHRVALFVS